MSKLDEIFQQRLQRHHDELRWLYMELYQNDSMFSEHRCMSITGSGR